VNCFGIFGFLLLCGYGNILRGATSHNNNISHNSHDYHILLPLTQGTMVQDVLQKYGVPEQLEVISCTCVTDVPHITAESVNKLLDIQKESCITRKKLECGLIRLTKQGCFSSIDLDMRKREQGYEIICTLHAAWIIDRVHISGFLLGKERLRQWYLLKPGSVFNEIKHREGIQAISAKLYDEGYCNAHIQDVLQRDTSRNSVIVHLYVSQEDRFHIKDMTINIIGAANQEYKKLYHAIRLLLKNELTDVPYERTVLNQSAEKIRTLLIDYGYLTSTIKMREHVNRDTAHINLIWDIEISGKNIFEFRGNCAFSRQQLLEQIMLFRDAATLLPAEVLAEELEQLYRRQGYIQVRITWQEDGDRIFFFITEGKRAIITNINLQGVHYFSHDDLKHYFSDALRCYTGDDAIKNACAALLRKYMDSGFWDAQLIRSELIVCDEIQSTYELAVEIQEGEQRYIARVELDDTIPPLEIPASITALQNLTAPCVCSLHSMQAQKYELVRALRKQGYLYAMPVAVFQGPLSALTIRWKCEQFCDVVKFGKTIIRIAGPVSSTIITRELAYQEGDIWDTTKMSKTIARLRGLGIFDVVSVVPDDITFPSAVKDVIIDCVVDTPYEVRARVGAQGVNQRVFRWVGGGSYKIGLTGIARNVSGNADVLRGDFDYSRYMHDTTVSYRIPWLFKRKLDTEVQLFSSSYDQPIALGSPEVLYHIHQGGLLLGGGNSYGALSGSCNVGLTHVSLLAPPCSNTDHSSYDRTALVAHALHINKIFFTSGTGYIFFEPSLVLNHLDDTVNPASGTMTLFAAKGMIPFRVENGSFLKLHLEHSWFVPWERLIIAMRFRTGIIIPTPIQNVIPPERFYLGGAHSLRSYEGDYAPPLNPFLNCCNTPCVVPIGGTAMANINCEIRMPLHPRITGAAFWDFGSLSAAGLPVQDEHVYISQALGFGLRVNTAIGPVRFDIGWKLGAHDRHTTGNAWCDRRYAWFVTLGQAF
jgi:outer membrane protein assembly factor BamA